MKEKYPDAKVATRRDRDGFAIVKISHEREWKYNLDRMLEHDQERENERQAETLEIILKHSLPEGLKIEDLTNYSAEELYATMNTT